MGSHLTDRALKEGYQVIVMDNLLTGDMSNIEHHMGNPDFKFVLHDVTELRGETRQLRVDVTELRGETRQLRVDVTELRRDMTELRVELRDGLAENRRHAGVLFESLRDDIRVLAEGFATVSTKLDSLQR